MIGFKEHQNPIPNHSHFVQLYHFHLYMMCSSWMKIQAHEFFLNAFQPPQLFCCQSRCCFSRSSCSLYPLPQHRTPLLNREPESPPFTSPHQLSPSRFTMDRPAMFPDMPPRSTSQLLPIFPLLSQLSQLCNDEPMSPSDSIRHWTACPWASPDKWSRPALSNNTSIEKVHRKMTKKRIVCGLRPTPQTLPLRSVAMELPMHRARSWGMELQRDKSPDVTMDKQLWLDPNNDYNFFSKQLK